jgi:hypothetical protein
MATVDAAGPFSVLIKAKESAQEASRLWNPTCNDAIGFRGGYESLLRGGIGDAINSELWQRNASLCDGLCTNTHPMSAEGIADPVDVARAAASRAAGYHGCIAPTCADVRPYCLNNRQSGMRARQICPLTCGCVEPLSSLALSLPSTGCGEQCMRSGEYLEWRAALPCEDMPNTDPRFVAYMDQLDQVAHTWPQGWSFFGGAWFTKIRYLGCQLFSNPEAINYLRQAGFPVPGGQEPVSGWRQFVRGAWDLVRH